MRCMADARGTPPGPPADVASASPRPADAEAHELAAEQRYLDSAFDHLAAMTARTSAAADDAAARAAGDWDATVAHIHLSRRLATMDPDAGPLCFGRIDEEDGPSWHIGRRHVEDAAGDPVVVDWRTPVAVPFYRATVRDPVGLRRRRRFILERRRLVDLLDENFDDPDGVDTTAASGLPDPLLAELGRARTGVMRDIVATIAAEQDEIIRAPLDVPVIVQGGPGTGKTAVGLHRAAYLLYEHRERLERQGVLVLGPNRMFLAYVAQVLPSLGEVAVTQTTLAGLVPQWRVGAGDADAVAAAKGDARLAEVMASAAAATVRPPTEAVTATTRWGTCRLGPDEVATLVEGARASGGPMARQRARFRRGVGRHVAAVLSERRPDRVLDVDQVQADLGADRPLQAWLGRVWPALSAPALVRLVLARAGTPAGAATAVLGTDQARVLHRAPTGTVARQRWTEADLPLLDEAEDVLGGPPRRYGHIVVDEAQDLSPMALRMVRRRSADGRSLTVLGDLAQATVPGAAADWDSAAAALGLDATARATALTTGYRVPAQIMACANGLLAVAAPGLPATASVRQGEEAPVFERVGPDGVLEQAARVLGARHLPFATSGRALQPGRVTLLAPAEAKGLEFDAVVVAEPAEILAGPGGAGLLYIALTRAVRHLVVVYSGALPPGLAGPPGPGPARR